MLGCPALGYEMWKRWVLLATLFWATRSLVVHEALERLCQELRDKNARRHFGVLPGLAGTRTFPAKLVMVTGNAAAVPAGPEPALVA